MAIVRKSFRNLEACSRIGLIAKCVDRLPTAEEVVCDLLIQLLSVLTSYSITVKEVKRILRELQAKNGYWVHIFRDILIKKNVLDSKFIKTYFSHARNAKTRRC